jgi:pyruvate/2-oxoglutarate dehydrogenase complex dihydrolipoamide dehydrogenase (E3) component
VAIGRRPNLKALSLDRAGVTHTDRGIKVNEQLKTSNRKIYAIGDAVGGQQFTHLANYHASIVIKNALFRLKPDVSAMHIPRVMYTDPELAQVGLTEQEAHEKSRRIRIYRWPFVDNDRAQCERQTEGFIKVITKKDGTVLGATIVGPEAGELLQLWIVAIAKEMRIGDLTSLVLPYPTFSEISKRVAFSFYRPMLHKRWLCWIIGLLRKLG